MLAIGDRPIASLGEESGENALPLDERRVGDVEAVEMEEVEGKIDETVLPAVFEMILDQRTRKSALAPVALCTTTSPSRTILLTGSSHGRRDAGETRRPVVAVPREQPRAAVGEMGLDG
jgi:hypothetical protein